MKKLYILDASGYIYRSYHAIRNMTNAQGESTNALFGFIRSIQKLRKDFNPEYLVAVFDGQRGAAMREEIYADYKAHRTGMPADLGYQIKWAQEACELMGIPYLSVPGVEADDTMGSVALWASKHGAEVYLCTSDKDLCQMVTDKVYILNTFKENQILGPKEVEEIHGVPPHLMVDLLAMMGDTSDNVPGVPGIGPKTAAALLQEHGSLDYILKHPQVVSGKKQEAFIQYADQARLSRRLVEIHLNVDFPKETSFFALKAFDVSALKTFYSSMNFSSLLRELDQIPQQATAVPVVESAVEYTLINDEEAFVQLLCTLSNAKEVSISVRGTLEQPIKSEIIGIAFSVQPNEAYYVPANGKLDFKQVLQQLKTLFENPSIDFFGHNIKYDYQLLKNEGITLANIAFDTMLASYLLNSHSRQHSLEQLMLDVFGKVKPAFTEVIGKGKKAISPLQAPLEAMSHYCCEDADYIFRLKEILLAQLHERKLYTLLSDLELPLLKVLASMERNGIFLDVPYLHQMSQTIQKQIELLEHQIHDLAGEVFNINSPKQLSEILFVKMGIRAPKKTATGLSTSAEVLESLQHHYPIAGKIMEYRLLEKLRSTYIDSLPLEVYSNTGRIHCTFNQSVAATGRLSCQNPNLQNIPIRSDIGRLIRGAFRAEKEGWSFLAADYSQIELRLLAHLSDDPHMIQAFENGEDIHASTAAYIFNIPLKEVTKQQRYAAKAVNFGIVYGQQAFGLSQELGVDIREAAAFIEAYFHRYRRVKEFVEASKEVARQTGRAVTYTGRERLIPEINSRNGQIRAAAERLAMNTPLQGTAADLIKMAMLDIHAKLRQGNFKGSMILQIHDELIFELPDSEIKEMESLVRNAMQGVLKLKVPLIVDLTVGKNWAQC